MICDRLQDHSSLFLDLVLLCPSVELRTEVYIAERIGVLSSEQRGKLLAELNEASAMLHGLVKSLKLKTEH